MATKVQTKAVIDAAVVAIKADIDNILPTGVNITDGGISFAPTHWQIRMNGGTLTAAQTTRDFITAALTSAARSFTLSQVLGRRGDDGVHTIGINTQLANYLIDSF